MWQILRRIVENPGMLVCRLHGEKSRWYGQLQKDLCRELPYSYEGRLHRLRLDGSLASVQFSLNPEG